MIENLELTGRRALVMGGTQGIGEAVVARLV
jgi:NAD(P)-dependent dehydrogenase (short-subunit alcohol dehydrogenase family)